LVKFKSPAAYYSAEQAVLSSNNTLSMHDSVRVNSVRLFNTNAAVTQNLHHVEMMVIESNDALSLQALKSNPAVELVEEEFFHPAPPHVSTFSDSEILRRKKPSDPSVSNPTMNMPWGIGAVKAPQAWSTTKGAGARVMVLDTGIDTGHPAVASRFEQGQNFTGGAATDVTDDVGHGTHVSGTIAADGQNGGLVGVAPEAKILMGKVCTDKGCSNIAIASGLNWAAQQQVDVVNMSLGGAILSPAEAQALQKVESAGVMVVAASGNDGKATVSFPAASPTVLAVGAVDSTLAKADFSNWGPQLAVVAPGVDVVSSVPRGTGRGSAIQMDMDGKGLNDVLSMPFVGSPLSNTVSNYLVFANLGKPEDFAAMNVKGKFALISRGDIPFADKVKNAIAAGAVGALIFNNAPGLMQGSLTTDGTEMGIPAVMIEQSIGLAAKAALASGQAVEAAISVIKTDYASFQGTSMATPHVTGVAALVRAANKSLTPAEVRDILKQTATPLKPNDQNQFGSGMVNAEAAVSKASLISFRLAN
jgi:subtilisin family serine protease